MKYAYEIVVECCQHHDILNLLLYSILLLFFAHSFLKKPENNIHYRLTEIYIYIYKIDKQYLIRLCFYTKCFKNHNASQ